ncbi:MAG: hypothetical protein JWN23_150 [Rhodocyclales bacterium]|nr:hypothetical protein [Rhodocyclales bacterium]
MKHISRFLAVTSALLFLGIAAPVRADEDSLVLIIRNHRFEPQTLEIPADKKVKLIIRNMDATPEEFDSDDLHREKLIPAGKEVAVYIGPLKPGSYKFIGEYNAATAVGTVVAK